MYSGPDTYEYDYNKSKKLYFANYDRKINAIISNIRNSTTINEKDKKDLLKKMSSKLIEEINRS